jgi:hypothetical protein
MIATKGPLGVVILNEAALAVSNESTRAQNLAAAEAESRLSQDSVAELRLGRNLHDRKPIPFSAAISRTCHRGQLLKEW